MKRNPKSRFSYAYRPDTVFFISEVLNATNGWDSFARRMIVFENGKRKSDFLESYSNGAWHTSTLTTYSYNAMGLLTQILGQGWINNAWKNGTKDDYIYDSIGNLVEEGRYYAGSDGVFKFNNGKLYAYDNAKHRTQEITVSAPITGIHWITQTNWSYGNDDLLDTLRRCDFVSTDPLLCENELMVVYEYPGPDSIVGHQYFWENNAWKYTTKEITHKKALELYSDKPDSIILFFKWADSSMLTSVKRSYFTYEDLGNNRVYFRHEVHNFLTNLGSWKNTYLREEWHHVKGTVGLGNNALKAAAVRLYPSPCKPGSPVQIPPDAGLSGNFRVLVFDAPGRLSATENLQAGLSLKAPEQAGTYSLVFLQNGRFAGSARLVVLE